MICIRKGSLFAYSSDVERNIQRFSSFAEADKADRDFYKNLTGNERVRICVELSRHVPEQRLERVSRIVKRTRR